MSSENRRQHPGGRSERGFASMDRQRQREIASQGGRAAHEKGTAHEFDSEEARRAGQRGGEAVSKDRQHMAEIGRKGGESRGNRASANNGGRGTRDTAQGEEDRPSEPSTGAGEVADEEGRTRG